jgi:hypothetical protein
MSTIIADGLDGLQEYFVRMPEVAKRAASLSINDVAGGTGLNFLKREIYSQIEFPKGYLDESRLGLAKRATPEKLEAVVKGRDRPTSLARFAIRQNAKRQATRRGVTVKVKKGQTRHLKSAWLVELNNGNLGLAVRVRPGERLMNKTKASSVQLSPNVYLLYGPSVDQVFSGVAGDNADKIGDMVADQFLRQFARLSRG